MEQIITRKLAMNVKLIRYTVWSSVFLISIAALAFLFFRPAGIFTAIRNKYPALTSGCYGILVAAFAAQIFNDSGIVAAATMMIYGVAPVIFLILFEKKLTKVNLWN